MEGDRVVPMQGEENGAATQGEGKKLPAGDMHANLHSPLGTLWELENAFEGF